MIRNILILVAIVALSISWLQAQNRISLDYNVQQLREEFSEENANWNYMSSVENLYMPDKGDLFMHRNNANSAYAFVTKWENNLREFNVMSRLKLGPSETPEQSIGIICLVQRDGKGAVVAEFNNYKQLRVKQLVGAYYRYISGTAEGKGWVKSSALRGKEEYNELEVRVALPQVDVYVNGKFALSFDVTEYGPGQMGLVIGPNTKAKADYFYVYSTVASQTVADSTLGIETKPVTPTEQLAKLRYELEMKERKLRDCQMERVKAVSTLEEQIGELNAANARLSSQNGQLAEFRDQILVDMDEDAFLTIAKSLKDEIIKNQRLEAQVQTYRDSLRLTHQNYNKLKLALLDKSIKKAEVQKVERDRLESINTKKEIEAELQDKRLKKEQEEWERKNYKTGETDQQPQSTEIGTGKKEALPAPVVKNAPTVQTKATPLPIPVRKAGKIQE